MAFTEKKPIIVTWVGSADIKTMNEWRIKHGLAPSSNCNRDKDVQISLPEPTPQNPTPGEESEGHNGPIRTLSDAYEAERIYLLVSKTFEPSAKMMQAWVQRGTSASCKIEIIQTEVDDPTSYDEVYAATDAFFRNYWDSADAERFWFNLTPGTPTTQAIMLYLSHVRYAGGKAWRVIGPRFVTNNTRCFEVRLPFRLPVEAWQQSRTVLTDETLLDELSIYAQVRTVSILLMGESGVGKSRFARKIHDNSGDASAPFVEVNCAALAAGDGNMFRAELFGAKKGSFTGAIKDTTGAFKNAENGTLFLDEIGEIPLDKQGILLRALQTREIEVLGGKAEEVNNVRIIAATNKNLMEEVRAGRFRQDLFYRIAMYPVTLPPLRSLMAESEEKFMKIVTTVLEELNEYRSNQEQPWDLPDATQQVLLSYTWPGNVRELRHVLLLSCVCARSRSSNVLKVADVNRHLQRLRPLANLLAQESDNENSTDFLPENPAQWLEDKERFFIARAMELTGHVKSKAAKRMGFSTQQLGYRLQKLG